jgi:hypothetical protein
VACVKGLGGAYHVGIPLPRSPSITCHSPVPKQHPSHPILMGRRGLGRCQWVWVVSPLSVITSRLEPRKQKKQISKFIKTRNKQKKTYIGPKQHNHHLGLHCIHLLFTAMVVEVGWAWGWWWQVWVAWWWWGGREEVDSIVNGGGRC